MKPLTPPMLTFARPLLLATLIATAASVPASMSARAETPEQKGQRIAVAAERHDDGFGDFTVQGKMILRTSTGDTSVRAFRDRILEVPGDSDKSVILFDYPGDVKGVALLTHAHKAGDDDQWLYLPAMKRVKRISSANRTGSFVGSEFAYEDFASQEVEKYRHRWLRDEGCPGNVAPQCHVVERVPTDPDSGYARQVVWMDTEHYRIARIDFFDRKNAPLKTLTADGFAVYAGKHWRAARMVMVNRQTGKSTELQLTGYRFKTGLRDSDFNQSKLTSLP
ncbi:MAG TPA: outer membrane lipoprotein-sorting protein [Azospirillum sp.]|nr:outer membrane lipoprotein-sorting protein [Azospirillum sp.]